MLIWLIPLIVAVIALLTAIILLLVDAFTSKYVDETPKNICIGIAIVCSIFSIVFGLICLSVEFREDLDYEHMQDRRAAILKEMAIMEQSQINTNESIKTYEKAVQFNYDLREAKRFSNNVVIGDMFNQRIANEIDFISIPE